MPTADERRDGSRRQSDGHPPTRVARAERGQDEEGAWPLSALLTLLLGLLVVVLITVATGWFVAQEFAFMSVDRARLAAQAAAGDRSAERALTVTRRTSFMLSGAQLGITVTGLLVGYVAEPLIGESLGTLLGGVGVPQAVGITVGTVLALLVSTVVQMLFGELVPKNLAIARPDPVARALARSTTLYLTLAGWLVRVFDASSEALLRLLRIEPVHDVEQAVSARDLEHIVRASQESGDLPADLGVLLDRVIDFPTRDVEHDARAAAPGGRRRLRRRRSSGAGERMANRATRAHPVVDDASAVSSASSTCATSSAPPTAPSRPGRRPHAPGHRRRRPK